MGLPEAWPDQPQLARNEFAPPQAVSPKPPPLGKHAIPRAGWMLLTREELGRVGMHPSCKEAGPPGSPTDFSGLQIQGKE